LVSNTTSVSATGTVTPSTQSLTSTFSSSDYYQSETHSDYNTYSILNTWTGSTWVETGTHSSNAHDFGTVTNAITSGFTNTLSNASLSTLTSGATNSDPYTTWNNTASESDMYTPASWVTTTAANTWAGANDVSWGYSGANNLTTTASGLSTVTNSHYSGTAYQDNPYSQHANLGGVTSGTTTGSNGSATVTWAGTWTYGGDNTTSLSNIGNETTVEIAPFTHTVTTATSHSTVTGNVSTTGPPSALKMTR
jgi:hypothetical protein